jgi:hypothetical protein
MMPAGRPSTYLPYYPAIAEAVMRMGGKDSTLARILNCNVVTINRWKRRHPEFCKALNRGKAVCDLAVEQALYNRAIEGDVRACIFWLKNRRPDLWRDRRFNGRSATPLEYRQEE